jgi:hypothetical protein
MVSETTLEHCRIHTLALSVETHFTGVNAGLAVPALSTGLRLEILRPILLNRVLFGVDSVFPAVVVLIVSRPAMNGPEIFPKHALRRLGNGSYNPRHRKTQGSHDRTG